MTIAAAPPDDRWPASSRRIARSALFRSGGEVLGKAASIALFVVMARELGRAGFGSFMFGLSLGTVLSYAAGLGTEELIAREVARDRSRVDALLADVLALKALTFLPVIVLSAGIVTLVGLPGSGELAACIAVGGVAVENLGRTYHGVFTAYERLGMISVSVVLQRVLTAAAGIAVLLAGGGVVAVAVVFAAGAVAGLVAARLVLRRFVAAPRRDVDRRRWMGILRAALPIGVAGLLLNVMLRADAALLGVLTGDAAEVGVYAAAFRLLEATLFVSWAVAASALPWLARREEGVTAARGFELGAKLLAVVLVPVGLSFALLAPELVDLLYGGQYGESVLPLRLLGAVTFLYGIGNLAGTVLIARDQPRAFTVLAATLVGVNLVLNLALIPRWGADAAAFSALVSSLLLAASGTFLVARRVGRVLLPRMLGAPLAGGLAMAAVVLALPAPAGVALGAGLLAHLGAAALLERLVFRDDFERLRGMIGR